MDTTEISAGTEQRTTPSEEPRTDLLLIGHTSPETAYIQDDYPYGRRLRCVRRCWIETTSHGQRFCAQTKDPKRSYEHWNAPKKSTYYELVVMVLDQSGGDEHGHVKMRVASMNTGEPALDLFIARYGAALVDDYSRRQIERIRAWSRAMEKITTEIIGPDDPRADEPRQTREEQEAIFNSAFRHELVQIRAAS